MVGVFVGSGSVMDLNAKFEPRRVKSTEKKKEKYSQFNRQSDGLSDLGRSWSRTWN